MFKLSNSSRANLSGLKTNVKLLIYRTIDQSKICFEIKAKDKVESRQNAARSFDVTLRGSNKLEVIDTFRQEFRKLQIEGHFCTCENLFEEVDLKNGSQIHFEIH